jgi:hypothetical protein
VREIDGSACGKATNNQVHCPHNMLGFDIQLGDEPGSDLDGIEVISIGKEISQCSSATLLGHVPHLMLYLQR